MHGEVRVEDVGHTAGGVHVSLAERKEKGLCLTFNNDHHRPLTNEGDVLDSNTLVRNSI